MKLSLKKLKNCRKTIFLSCIFLSLTCAVFAQKTTITGRVYDSATNEPLIGALIMEKGTTNATTADLYGKFSITVNPSITLEFSFLGYEMLAEPLAGRTSLNVGLRIQTTDLDEVVVIGYGTARKRDLTGAVGSIKLDNSPRSMLPNTNAFDALKGQIPGFDVGGTRQAGANPDINIRGQNSIRASNAPLIVLDGVIFIGSLNEINPNDIASIDVLKDASSAAVYGSQATNGIILITTKKGKSGKSTIRLRAIGGFQTYTKRPDMLSPEGYIQIKRDVKTLNGGSSSDLELQNLFTEYEYKAYQEGSIIDWFDEVTRVATLQDYNVSVSGANDQFNYYLSGQYLDQQGVVVNDQFKKVSLTSKLEAQITDWLKIGATLGVITKNGDGKEAYLRTATINAPYSFRTTQFADYKDVMERYPQGQTTSSNPLWQTQEFNEDRNQNYRSLFFARIDLPWINGLSYTFNYSLNRWEGHQARFWDERYFMDTMKEADLKDQTKYLKDANGYKEHVTRTDWYMNNLFNYNRTFNAHVIDVTLMYERSKETRTDSKLSAKDFSTIGTTALKTDALELGNSANRGIESGKTVKARLGYLARVNYVYKDRYLLTGSIRRDGYSGFAPGYQYGAFMSVAAAWTISEEDFFKNAFGIVDFLKIRVSYGENGNSNVDAYSSFPSMASSSYLLGNSTVKTQYADKLANKSLQWEATGAYNVGLNFAVLNHRLSGNVEYYNSTTTDLLLNRSIPIMNGFQNVIDNIGKVHNWGIELQLNSINAQTRNFSWLSGLNFWMNRNKIKSLYGPDDDVANGWFIDKSLGAKYTFVFDGIVQNDDVEYIAIYGANPGDVKFKDLNRDGKIDADNDRKIVGYQKPNFTMNLSNTLNYKNFQLYFALHWMAGGGKDNYCLADNIFSYLPGTFSGGGANNWLDKPYWMPDRSSNKVPRPNYTNPYGYQFPKRYDFLRLQDVSLSYNFDKKMLSKIPIESLKLYVSGKNMLTFTYWDGQDPETQTQYAAESFPVMRSVVFGIDISL